MKDELASLGNGAHALAYQIMGNADDAADAVHDAFANVLAKPKAYDPSRGSLKPWFLKVVRNRCFDLIRKRRPQVDAIDVINEIEDLKASPEKALVRDQQEQAIHQALATLQREQREIIILRDFLELSYAEIADLLTVPKGTVMSRLHRSRLALKEALEGYE